MDRERELLLQIAGQARRLSASLENGQIATEWPYEKAHLDTLLASAPHSLLMAAERAIELHREAQEAVPEVS